MTSMGSLNTQEAKESAFSQERGTNMSKIKMKDSYFNMKAMNMIGFFLNKDTFPQLLFVSLNTCKENE